MSLEDDLLVEDFGQCFEQLRHYDERFGRTLEFATGGIVAVFAGSAALVQSFGLRLIITVCVSLLLAISGVAGILLALSLARNRVYFAFVARHVNTIRSLYVGKKPGGLFNAAGFYTDPRFPRIWNPTSMHSLQIYFLSICNAIVCSAAWIAHETSLQLAANVSVFVDFRPVIVMFGLLFILQLGSILLYWRSKERQGTANSAVLGSDAEAT